MDLEEARKEYNKGKITFKELDHIFSLKATSKELNEFCKTPVYDRPNFVIGKSQKEMNKEWNNLIK